MVAVNNNGMALEMASISFRSDEDVVMAAVKRNGDAIKFADKYLLND
jgi:hypothetical protein